MAEGIEFDFTELTKLAANIGEVPGLTKQNLRKAVTVTAHRVKDSWNEKLYTAGHADRTGGSIDYDVSDFQGFGGTVVEAEVGARRGRGRQAGVVRLLENGSVHNAPHGYGSAALNENESDFEHGIDLAAGIAEKEAGL